jgi:hypothetical protein
MEEESVQETVSVPSVSQIRYPEVPVDSVEVTELDTEDDELSSAEIVVISKTKTSVTRTPKNRVFPKVTLASGEPISTKPTAAALNHTIQQDTAPIAESIDEAIEYVDPDLEAQVDALEKWQDVCPPTSSPLTSDNGQLLPCLPRDKSCPAGSFCWFSTEEDYICCTVPGDPQEEQPTSQPSPSPADSSATLSANSSAFESSAERNVTSLLEQSVVLESVAHNSTEKDVNAESIADVQTERLQPVPGNFGREQSTDNIWFKPQPQANRVEQPSVQNETLSISQLNGTETTEEATKPTETPISSRRRAQARVPATKEETPYDLRAGAGKGPVPPAPVASVGGINGPLSNTKLPTPGLPSFVEQASIPLYAVDSSKKSNLPDAIERPAKNAQPKSRYVPNPAGGYTLEEYVVPQQNPDEAKAAAKEAAKVFYLNQIRNGWPYADEFYVPDRLNLSETSDATAAVVDEGPIEIQFPQIQQIPRPRQQQQPELNPDIEYNYSYARWQDRNRARWSK